MPARQRGFARKRGNTWLAVWREDGRERSRRQFPTRTDALDYANAKADAAVERETAIRFRDPVPRTATSVLSVGELVDAFLARHDADAATIKKLRSQLKPTIWRGFNTSPFFGVIIRDTQARTKPSPSSKTQPKCGPPKPAATRSQDLSATSKKAASLRPCRVPRRVARAPTSARSRYMTSGNLPREEGVRGAGKTQ
jgi:hypothetical protein